MTINICCICERENETPNFSRRLKSYEHLIGTGGETECNNCKSIKQRRESHEWFVIFNDKQN